MRLILHDTFLTAPLVHPLKEGWVELPDLEVLYVPQTEMPRIEADDVALIPAGAVGLVARTHQIVPDIAVVADQEGPISVRVPVRPDEIERGIVRLIDVTPTGEVLARATLTPFFGIEVEEWTAEENADAQIVILEGAEAIREAQGGFSEDLCRSWFILTNLTTVTYVLVAPLAADRKTLEPILAPLVAAQGMAKSRRREIRRAVATANELPIATVNASYDRIVFALDQDDRDSLAQMLKRGTQGSRYPNAARLKYLEPAPEPEPEPEA